MRRFIGFLVLGLFCLGTATALANGKLKTKGEGADQELDESQFSADQKPRYQLFKQKCTKCHAMQRPIVALQTGRTPISNGVFDEPGIKTYVVKMMRKPNSGIEKDQAKELIDFLRYARALAEGK